MHITEDKKTGVRTFHWTRPNGLTKKQGLEKEIAKASKEIEGLEKYLDWHKWNYEEAKKNYERRVKRIRDLKDWISFAKELITKEDKEPTEEQDDHVE